MAQTTSNGRRQQSGGREAGGHFIPQICFSIKGFLPVLKRITKVRHPPQVTDSGYSYRYSYRFPIKFTTPDTVRRPPQVTDSGYSHRYSYRFPLKFTPSDTVCPTPKVTDTRIPIGIPMISPQIHPLRYPAYHPQSYR